MDTNTPKDKEAAPHDIERMWRERFGLDLSAREKVKLLLEEPEGWQYSSNSSPNASWFHKQHPEFTIAVEDAEDHIDCNQEWTRGEISRDRNHAAYYVIYYHQTELARLHYVSFDDSKKNMVAPEWETRNGGRFYYYTKNSLLHALQRFHVHFFEHDSSVGLRVGGMAGEKDLRGGQSTVSIPVATEAEISDFLRNQENSPREQPIFPEEEQYRVFLKNQFDFEAWLEEPAS